MSNKILTALLTLTFLTACNEEADKGMFSGLEGFYNTTFEDGEFISYMELTSDSMINYVEINSDNWITNPDGITLFCYYRETVNSDGTDGITHIEGNLYYFHYADPGEEELSINKTDNGLEITIVNLGITVTYPHANNINEVKSNLCTEEEILLHELDK